MGMATCGFRLLVAIIYICGNIPEREMGMDHAAGYCLCGVFCH